MPTLYPRRFARRRWRRLSRTEPRGSRILLARADRGRTVLKDELEQLADVDQVAVYHNADAPALPDSVVERIAAGTIDWITLTSPAITTRLHALLPADARKRIGREIRLASLSPVTTEAGPAVGWTVAVEAAEFTWEGLVRAIVDQVAKERELAKLEHGLDALPQQEARPQDEHDVHSDVSPEDAGGQVEQEDQADDACHSDC